MACYAIGNPFVKKGQIATIISMLEGLTSNAMFDELAERSLMTPANFLHGRGINCSVKNRRKKSVETRFSSLF